MEGKVVKGSGGHPTAARSAEIDQLIVVSTLSIFSRQGSDFSMDQVAAEAGVSKQAIYRRFDGKLALLLAAIETGVSVLVRDATDDLPGDPIEALRVAARRLFERGRREGIGATVHLEAEAIRSAEFRASLLRSRKSLDTAIVARLTAVARAGHIVKGSIRMQTETLLDLLLGANIRLNTAQMFSDEERSRMFDERWEMFEALITRRPEPAGAH